MTDQKFLWWIHEKLLNVHGENQNMDYMHHLRAIIADYDPRKETKRIARMDTSRDILLEKFE